MTSVHLEIFQGNKHALVVNYWNSTVVVLDIDKRTGAIKSTGKPKSIYDPNQGKYSMEFELFVYLLIDVL